MKTLELTKYHVKELQVHERKEIDGGFLIFVAYYVLYKAGEAAIQAAYEKGYDKAQNNCECQN